MNLNIKNIHHKMQYNTENKFIEGVQLVVEYLYIVISKVCNGEKRFVISMPLVQKAFLWGVYCIH